MTTDIIFDLLNPGHLSPQMADELKDANDRWGEPSTETLKMIVWLAMLAEKGHYTRLIDHARRWFTQELETVEATENAYRALPAPLVIEPLHSQGLSACRDARQGAARALKGINSQYQRNQTAISSASATDESTSLFEELHTAFMAFYRDMDEVQLQVMQVQEISRESARLLWPLLETQRQALEEKRAERKQLQRQIRNVRRIIARRTAALPTPDQVSRQMIPRDRTDKEEIEKLKRRNRELYKEITRFVEETFALSMQIKEYEQNIEILRCGPKKYTLKQIAEKHGVSGQSVSDRISKLIEDEDLSSVGREGKKHKKFNDCELEIIETNWPTRGGHKLRRAPV